MRRSLHPHLHVIFLDGAYHEQGDAHAREQLGHLKTSEVGRVLERALRRMARYLRRHGALEPAGDADEGDAEDADADADAATDASEKRLVASAVSGQTPPAGPQWQRGLSPLTPRALAYDKPLCASRGGFTLHAAMRAGALDLAGREALLRYVLRPPLAQERLELRPDGLVRIVLKRAFGDGTSAASMDPLSLLCRLATSVPPPRFHIVKYAGVLAPASSWRSRVVPPTAPADRAETPESPPKATKRAGTYRPWAELLKRTFGTDVLQCPNVPQLRRADEARGHDHPPHERRSLPPRDRRAPQRARALSQPRAAVLQEHRPAPQGARRRRRSHRVVAPRVP